MFEETKQEHKVETIGNIENKPADTQGMIATIDADTIAYAVASVCEAGDDYAGYTLNIDYALEEACNRVDNIVGHTGCKSCELHFTSGKNFRFTLTSTYKSNRKGQRTPAGLYELKEAMLTRYPGKMHTEVEADDYVSWQKSFWPDDYIVCSPDKDVYNGSAGTHFNYYKRAKGKYIKADIPMRWVVTTKEESVIWLHYQALIGDSSDGIAGIHRCGPKKAEKILAGLSKPIDLWDAVLNAYSLAGMTEKEAILNMRLLSMHQMDKGGNLCLWTAPTE